MQGSSLKETIADDLPVREGSLFGIHGGHVNVTDGRYVYMRAPKDPSNSPLYEYTLMPTHMNSRFHVSELQDIELAEPFSFTKGCQTMKIPTRGMEFVRDMMKLPPLETELYDLKIDPGQLHPIKNPQVETRMIQLMRDLLKENDAPHEQYKRMGLTQ
jgi:hypothetical protein